MFILVGGWLMLRAWRINKYGSTNTKVDCPRSRSTTPRKTAQGTHPVDDEGRNSSPAAKKPPTASKRYTPKAAPRKKIPKATE